MSFLSFVLPDGMQNKIILAKTQHLGSPTSFQFNLAYASDETISLEQQGILKVLSPLD